MKQKSKTRPIGKGTKNVPINMPVVVADQLKKVAELSGMSVSQYAREILTIFASTETVIKRGLTEIKRKDGTTVHMEHLLGESLGERVFERVRVADAKATAKPSAAKQQK